ncbi:MAG: glycerophosphodiester phosphodiesterase [Alphaproteobacteria bacterium]
MRRLVALGLLLAAAAAPVAAFDLQAHRGGRGLWPENTLPAFAGALSLGVDTLELDVGVTRDGIVVIHHDDALNPATARGADGRWIAAPGPTLRSLSAAELATYDVGRLDPASRYARGFPDQQAVDGTRVPALADLFGLVRRRGDASVRFNIETKIAPDAPDRTLPPDEFALHLLAVIREAGMTDRVTVQSFDWRTLVAIRLAEPAVPTVHLTVQQRWRDTIRGPDGGPTAWTAGFSVADHGGSVPRMVKAAGGAIWSPYWRDPSDADLAEARRLGLPVIVWTVNEPADMEALIARGVDGIITDRPDILRRVMASRGMKLPAAAPR